MNILVIDDSEDSRDITEAALFTAGYRDIMSAGSAVESYRLLKLDAPDSPATPVDLILLDIVMPEVDGIEACAHIRNDTRYVDVPIIMVTMMGDTDSLASAFVAGATDYITKPIDRVELLARARSALRLKAELDRRLARERQLVDFLATWGDRRATMWIDEPTGLLVGEIAEAYLTAETEGGERDISIIALAVDRLDVIRTAQGDKVASQVLRKVARAVQDTAATVGVLAACYRNGLIVLVLPKCSVSEARALGETLRNAVARLRIGNSEAIAANHVTASLALCSGRIRSGADRVNLLTRAITTAHASAADGGNRLVAINL
jgi:PleD family two-component response regulator